MHPNMTPTLNKDESDMSAFREREDTDFYTDGGGSKEATAFLFPFAPVGTPRGRGRDSKP